MIYDYECRGCKLTAFLNCSMADIEHHDHPVCPNCHSGMARIFCGAVSESSRNKGVFPMQIDALQMDRPVESQQEMRRLMKEKGVHHNSLSQDYRNRRREQERRFY